ncbi:MAG: DUF1292 domain-containing protein [Firmicutes bacterium]|nr:DUF1292 domain-containing protein [Bacillota bacterium]MCL2770920.1 DUF1292 domain-containing protein [Bacillota bacterium]
MAQQEVSILDQILDPNNNDPIVLTNAHTGEKIAFEQIAFIPLEKKERYFIMLRPVEKMAELEDDEALIFEISENQQSGEVDFNIVEDDKIEDEVYKEYLRLYNEANK